MLCQDCAENQNYDQCLFCKGLSSLHKRKQQIDLKPIMLLNFKEAVISNNPSWGRRENGWVTEKMETARLGMKNIRY